MGRREADSITVAPWISKYMYVLWTWTVLRAGMSDHVVLQALVLESITTYWYIPMNHNTGKMLGDCL